MKFIKTLLIILIYLNSCSSSSITKNKKKEKPPMYLDCNYTKRIFQIALSKHIDFNEVSKKLEERALKSFIFRIDPSNSILLDSEVKTLQKENAQKGIFSDLGTDCSTILPKLYKFSINKHKRYTQEIIKIAESITQKEVDGFDILQHTRKYEKHPKTMDEMRKRTRESTVALFKYLKATDDSFKKIKTDFISDSKKSITQYDEKLKELNTKQGKHDQYQFILGALIGALDAHSNYVPHTSFNSTEEEFNQGFFFGIGILIGKEKYKGIKVKEVYKNGPAGKNGTLKSGDIIFRVNNHNVKDLPLEEGVRLIKGPKGTKVKLDFIRTEKNKMKKMTVHLVRNKVFYTESIKVSIVKKKKKKIVLITLDQFFRNAAQGIYQKYISAVGANKVDAIILNLLGNGGGLLTEAIELTDHFIDRGPVVALKNAQNSIHVHKAKIPGELAKTVPMLVIVNKVSASASEIVAGALKDYNRALIVGPEHTFGKGSVQDVLPIMSGKLGGLHITVAKFFRPLGKSTQLKGISTDITVPGFISNEYKGEMDQLFPVSFETIPPVIKKRDLYSFPYKKYITRLQKRSKDRVKKNKIFTAYKKDPSSVDREKIEQYKPIVNEAVNIMLDYLEFYDTEKKLASKKS